MPDQNLFTSDQLLGRIGHTADQLTLLGLIALTVMAALAILGVASATTGTLSILAGPALTLAGHLAIAAGVLLVLAITLELSALALTPRHVATATLEHPADEDLLTWEFPARRAA